MGWLEAHATTLDAIGGIATAVAGVVAVLTLMRAGLDSASRTRPYVVVEYEVPSTGGKVLSLVVRNAGSTAARNMQVEFEPPFVDGGPRTNLGRYVARRYARPVPVLAPGQAFRSLHVANLQAL